MIEGNDAAAMRTANTRLHTGCCCSMELNGLILDMSDKISVRDVSSTSQELNASVPTATSQSGANTVPGTS